MFHATINSPWHVSRLLSLKESLLLSFQNGELGPRNWIDNLDLAQDRDYWGNLVM